MRSDRSQRVVVEGSTLPLGVNVADHEIMVLDVTYVLLFVVKPSAAVVSVNVRAAVPEQVPFSYRLNTTVPAVPAGVTVAESCGSQLCVVVMDEGCLTVKHSVAAKSLLGGTCFVASPLNSPLKQYVPAASGAACVFTSADKIGCVVVLLTGMSEPTCVPPVEQTLFASSWAGAHR